MDGYEWVQCFGKMLSENEFESLSARAVSFYLSVSWITWTGEEHPAGAQYMLN